MEPSSSVPVGNYSAAVTEYFPRTNKIRLIESSVESKHVLGVLPSNATASLPVSENFLEFTIRGCSGYLLDMSSIKLEIKGQCRKNGDTDLGGTDKAVLIDNSLHGLFKGVSISLNGNQIENNSMYPLTSHLRILTETKPFKKKTLLANAGFWGNSHKYEDLSIWNDVLNDDAAAQKNAKFHWVAPLILDLSTVDGYILDNIGVTIRLEYASPNFIMNTHDDAINARFKITEAKMYIDRVKPYTSALLALNDAIEQSPMSYIYNKSLIKTFMLTANTRTHCIDAPFQSHVPGKLMLAMVDMNAYAGNYKKNPIYLKNYNLTKIGVTVNSRSIYNISCLPSTQNAMLYDAVLSSIGQETDHLIIKKLFDAGYSVIVLDLVPERVAEGIAPDKSGHLKIELEFADGGIDRNILCCVVGDTNASLYIDKHRNVSTDAFS